MSSNSNIDNPFAEWVNLAQARLGAEVVYATDDFFADKARMIEPQPAVFIPDKYDENGKWMDGWESRRKRDAGYDFAILKLGVQGIIKGFDLDTSNFTGNYAPAASIEGCVSDSDIPGEDVEWVEILGATSLQGNSHHYLPAAEQVRVTHLRLNIYPDGGVARFRVYAEVTPDIETLRQAGSFDLLAVENGGRALLCNDEHFGSMHNLTAPGRGVNMGDGWETRRRREPGNDWVILSLGCAGTIEKIVVDTAHFKGNYPHRVSIQAARLLGGTLHSLVAQSLYWETLLSESHMQMDHIHEFVSELNAVGAVTHVRMNIFPDGGVSRLRLIGSAE